MLPALDQRRQLLERLFQQRIPLWTKTVFVVVYALIGTNISCKKDSHYWHTLINRIDRYLSQLMMLAGSMIQLPLLGSSE
jgi:hypothetical protein